MTTYPRLIPLASYEPPLDPQPHKNTEEQHMEDDVTSSNNENQTSRQIGADLYDLAEQLIAEDDTVPASELAKRPPSERFAEAQAMALQAIYYELRHGHDQTQQQTKALHTHAKEMEKLRADLRDHAGAMDKARGALYDHAEALSRYRHHE